MLKRIPSLHIKKPELASILATALEDYNINIDYNQLADTLLELGKGVTPVNRTLYITNDKLKRDADKVQKSPRSNTALFAKILILERRKLKHRGLIVPKVGDKDWLNYKEATELATEFCNEYNFTLAEGYRVYINLGMPKMRNFSIFKFKQLHNSILEDYEANRKIQQDKYPQQTKRAHSVYLRLIQEKVGFAQGFEDRPTKYAAFVDAMELARRYGAEPTTYIQAQFSAMDWQNTVPDPLQLVGTKAVERLQKYCFEQGIKLNDSNAKKAIDFNKIFNKK